MFFVMIKQTYQFQCIITHYRLFVLLIMCNIVAKFTLVQIIFIMPFLSALILAYNAFKLWLIKFVLASCHLKNHFVITYLLEDEQELSLGILILCKHIYYFWWSMLVFYPTPYVFYMFSLCFPMFFIIYWTNLLTRCPVPISVCFVFELQKRSKNESS